MSTEVEFYNEQINVSEVLTTLLSDFSSVANYRMLRDSLPRRLATMLKCRCILIYLQVDEALQLASGSFDDIPGWSSALLAVAHINPINIHSELPEARAFREKRVISQPSRAPTLLALPLIYRQRCTGVLIAIRGRDEKGAEYPKAWSESSIKPMMAIAGVVALLLENVRLLEHDHARIRELSLLNSMSSQMNSGIYDIERLRAIILQRTKEIAAVDLCDLFEPSAPENAAAWMHPRLRELLMRRFQEQRSPQPLIVERPGNGHDDYFEFLPDSIKTFFVLPLLSGRMTNKQNGSILRGALSVMQEAAQMPIVLGCIFGVYYRPWKLGSAEVALLRVLASQSSTVLENMRLMEEVVKARNEARTLLRQVLDDQRMNALILESVPSGLVTTDQNNCIHTFNRAAEVILGYHHYEVLGQPLRKYLDLDLLSTAEDDASNPNALSPAQKAFFAAMHTGEAQHQTVIAVDRHDREIVLALDTRPLYDESGKQVGMLIAFTDTTLMHRLEEEKRRLDRLALLGEMAANVAHEVRNPLASIKTSIQLLRDDLVQNENMPGHETETESETSSEGTCLQFDWTRESVAVILKEVERLDTIVHELLLFGKPHRLHRARCTIQDLIDHVLAVLERQCHEANVEVHRVYENVASIWLDIDQIEQVLLNLCLNAMQAMPDGGILTVVCQRISAEQAIYDTAGTECPATQRPSGSPGTAASAYAWLIDQHASQKESRVEHWLEIMIRDTGVGMSNDQLEHIFQPFYTTKAHGIGLGLAITRRLVEDHGGYLRVESQFGYGTTMAVRLPFVTDETMQDDVQEKAFVED